MKNKQIVEGLLLKKQPRNLALRVVLKLLEEFQPNPDDIIECAFKKVLNRSVIQCLDQFEIANAIRASVIAYPEHADYMSSILVSAYYHNARNTADMYKERRIREGFLLGMLESVVMMQEHYEDQGRNEHKKFQRSWLPVVYQLAFTDGTNWEVKDKRMAGRISNAIAKMARGYGGQRDVRIGQFVSMVKALNANQQIFVGGWQHDTARNFVHGLFNCSYVQDQISMLCGKYPYSKEYDQWKIPEALLS